MHDNYGSSTFTLTDASPACSFKSPIPMYESTGTAGGVARLEGQAVHANIMVTMEGLTGHFSQQLLITTKKAP
jgi:hypothetical protein